MPTDREQTELKELRTQAFLTGSLGVIFGATILGATLADVAFGEPWVFPGAWAGALFGVTLRVLDWRKGRI